MTVSIIIPSYNRHEILMPTLRKLLGQKQDFLEIIVVDQKGEKETPYFNIQYFYPKRVGQNFARNFGTKKAKGDIVLFLDDDIAPDKNLVKEHLKCYVDPNIVGVGGQIKEPGMALVGVKVSGKIDRFFARFTKNFAATPFQEVDFVPGGNMSFRREAILTIGGFDKHFDGRPGFDEIDFCLRLKRATKKKLIYQPKASLTHLKYKTGGQRVPNVKTYWFGYYYNFGLFFKKNASLWILPLFLFFQARHFWKNARWTAFQGFFAGLTIK